MDDRAIAEEALAVLWTGRQIEPFTGRYLAFTLADAYRVARMIRDERAARGEPPVGRKIGFTNRSAWPKFGGRAPIWGPIYSTTVHDLGPASQATLAGLAEPRIEPEIIFGLAASPTPDMDERALAGCIAWVAHGFEIVHSIYPGWTPLPADAVVGFGMHASLWIGPRHPFPSRASEWTGELATFDVELFRNEVLIDRGRGANVLDGPLSALRALIDVLAADTHNPPLAPGEIVTTGSLTRAPPIAAGEVWTTHVAGIPLEGVRLALSAE
jgi:2-oxo-3-hexenedioate decarboxylase